MAKRPLGMQNLKRRLSPAMERSLPAGLDVSESGTYPVSSPHAGALLSSPHAASAVVHREDVEVTLVVYGWHNVQPGTLSWVFPSFDAAMKAASALRNATQWAILGGRDASGVVLAERSA